ncbi:MAG: hypothetical protein ISR65_09240 [Bacteriovoracaceae bacterium]|nr:hypothetical protein [Bacteriovoracaceae bacterium]
MKIILRVLLLCITLFPLLSLQATAKTKTQTKVKTKTKVKAKTKTKTKTKVKAKTKAKMKTKAENSKKFKYFAEPYLGIGLGSFDQDLAIEGTNDQGVTLAQTGSEGGVVLGLIAGTYLAVKYDRYSVFLDLRLESANYEVMSVYTDDSTIDGLSIATAINFAFNLSESFRASVGYNFWDYLNLSYKNVSNKYYGSGFKGSVSYQFSSGYALNIEYSEHKYDERDGRDLPTSYSSGQLNIDEGPMDVSELYIFVSVPINF